MSRLKPLQYNPNIHDQQIYEWAKAGLSQNQIASRFDIQYKTLGRMMDEFPSFRQSWEKGRNENIVPVISELYKLCFPHEEKTEEYDGDGKLINTTIKIKPPNVNAINMLLKAKDPGGNWKDSISISPSTSNITITLSKEDEKL